MPLSSDQRVKSYCAGLVHQRVDLVAGKPARTHERGGNPLDQVLCSRNRSSIQRHNSSAPPPAEEIVHDADLSLDAHHDASIESLINAR
jgi:hypothetical protein